MRCKTLKRLDLKNAVDSISYSELLKDIAVSNTNTSHYFVIPLKYIFPSLMSITDGALYVTHNQPFTANIQTSLASDVLFKNEDAAIGSYSLSNLMLFYEYSKIDEIKDKVLTNKFIYHILTTDT